VSPVPENAATDKKGAFPNSYLASIDKDKDATKWKWVTDEKSRTSLEVKKPK
jgi:hypothetical protein